MEINRVFSKCYYDRSSNTINSIRMIDLGKAVIASKEDEVKKATKAFGKKIPICSWSICSSMVSYICTNIVSGLGIMSR